MRYKIKFKNDDELNDIISRLNYKGVTMTLKNEKRGIMAIDDLSTESIKELSEAGYTLIEDKLYEIEQNPYKGFLEREKQLNETTMERAKRRSEEITTKERG